MLYHKHQCSVTIFACQTALFNNLEKKNIPEKLHTSWHQYLLFAIHIYFADFFLDFSRGLKSTNSFTWIFERHFTWIEFHEWNILFWNISCKLQFAKKNQNLKNLKNRIHAKINLLKLYQGTFVKHLIFPNYLWKQFLIIQVSHYK